MTYLYEFALFLAQTVTIVAALIILVSAIVSINMRHQHPEGGRLRVSKLNERLRDLRHTLEDGVLPPETVKKKHKTEAKAQNKALKAQTAALAAEDKASETQGGSAGQSEVTVGEGPQAAEEPAQRVYVIRFEGDVRASKIDHLRREVSAVLTLARPTDEVVVVVESPGGMVHSYGLAASQLTRIRNQNIPLTVIVDKVAASGGYLMAAVANKILAAPFAVVGSIGVVAQVPNVHRLLKKNDVDVEVITAGKYKRTLTVFGENTPEAKEKFTEELEDVHHLFQEFVTDYRPGLDIATVATGEAWYGKRAVDLNLVDELMTSDEYLMRACDHSEVFEVQWEDNKRPIDRLFKQVNGMLERAESLIPDFRR